MTTVEAVRGITGGVDTHRDVHVAAALDPPGGVLGSESFPTDVAGYQAPLKWLETFGDVTKIGTDRIDRSVGGPASRIPSMPSKQPGPPSVAERPAAPSRETAQLKPSACSWSPSARLAGPSQSPGDSSMFCPLFSHPSPQKRG